MIYGRGRFSRIVVITVMLAPGCTEQKTKIAKETDAVFSPADAVDLLKSKEGLFCLNATGSDGRRVTVGRLSPSQAKDEAGPFYFAVFNEGTDITGQRQVRMNRRLFTEPADAVQVAMQLGVTQFQQCRFSEM